MNVDAKNVQIIYFENSHRRHRHGLSREIKKVPKK